MLTPIILAILLASSAGYFIRTVARRLQPMKAARPALTIDQPARRLWRVFTEVMLQTRVIRDRPVAGTLHALVMWGFFAFAWVSAEHIWQAFHGLENARPDTSWYGTFAAVWAAAVTVGMTGLAFRRFILRPRELGEISKSSAIVSVLIVALMLTYLAGWRGLEPGSPAWQVNWWLHALSFAGMFWVIPNSKHLHLLLGPVAIFFRNETTSPTRPLREDDDDDLGMLRFGDMSWKDILDVNACVECGRCTEMCPANIIGGSLSPKHVILNMQHGLLAGGATIAGTVDEVSKGEAWVSEQDLYQCLSCGACEQACPVGIEHVGAKILDLRRGLVSEGRTHNDKLASLFTTMERSPHNAWGASQEARRKLIESEKFPIFDGSQEYLLWMGCGLNYDPHGQDLARAMKKILDAAAASWGVLARETCCGEPARRAGNEYLYMALSEKVIESLTEKRAKNIIACDPHCTRMFDVDYRQNASFEALGIDVTHHSEFLAGLAPKLPLTTSPQTVTFHDPCYLARGRGVTAEPRAVLQACGAEIVEMKHNRERTFCCGAGGAQLFIADDTVEMPGGRVNQKRFEEVAATGVETVVVACPYCPIMLNDAAQAAKNDHVQILDIAEILAASLH